MKNIIKAGVVLALVFIGLTFFAPTEIVANIALQWFLPGLFMLFVLARFLASQVGVLLDQPPLMIFLMALVIKLLGGLTLLLVFLVKQNGPMIEGSFVFLGIYLIFEILEINWFLSILRPDSKEKTPE